MGIAYFVSAGAMLLATRSVSGIAVLWPASGVILAALLLRGSDARWPVVLACAAGCLCANLLAGNGLAASCGFTLVNMLDGFATASLVGRAMNGAEPFGSLKATGWFVAAGNGDAVDAAAPVVVARQLQKIPGRAQGEFDPSLRRDASPRPWSSNRRSAVARRSRELEQSPRP